MSEPLNPLEPFYMAVSEWQSEGDLRAEPGEEVEGFFRSESEASECIKDLVRRHGSRGWVYLCQPAVEIRRVPNVRRIGAAK